MTIIPLEIGTQSNYGRYGQDGAARIINGYAEELGKEGKHSLPVYACAGLAEFATLAEGGAVRAMIEVDGQLYVVAGRVIYRVDSAGYVEQIGGLPSDGHVTMSRNLRNPNPQITVTCDGVSKIITGTTVTDLGDSDLPPANSNFPLGPYTIFTIPDGRYYWSAIADSSDVNALDYASAEANPDGIVISKPLGSYAVHFGTRTTEFHVLTGDSATVFSRSHVINVGCYAAGSVAEIPIITSSAVTGSIAFASTDAQGAYAGISLVENLSARKISTHAVDRAVRDEPNPLSITSCAWSDGGHAFYCISGSTFSWCWDSATGQWHERQSYGRNRWKVRSVCKFGSHMIAGDYFDNKLYIMSGDHKDEAGEPLIMSVQTPPVVDYPGAIEFNSLYLDVIPQGPGLVSGDDHNVNPQAMLSWSDDGINFTANRLVDLGRLGETIKRVQTHRLGQTRPGCGRTFRVSVSADVAKGLMGAAADVNRIAA